MFILLHAEDIIQYPQFCTLASFISAPVLATTNSAEMISLARHVAVCMLKPNHRVINSPCWKHSATAELTAQPPPQGETPGGAVQNASLLTRSQHNMLTNFHISVVLYRVALICTC